MPRGWPYGTWLRRTPSLSCTPTISKAPYRITLLHRIVDRADGNPFFLEELTRTLIEHEELQDEVTLPDTIQGVLMARIDRLSEAAKRLVQTAAVLDREFSLRLLEAIWDETPTLPSLLIELKQREFLYERPGADEPVYVFKHALTQEVAYASLLVSRRQALHAAAGQALEALYMDSLEEAYDRLSYHYAQTNEAAKVVDYLTRFAEQLNEESWSPWKKTMI